MPKKEVDYSKTIIYKIVCNDLKIKDCYVGHTTDFIKRKSCHKKRTLEEKDKVYQFIRENGDWNNWSMIEIEKYPCKNSNEARAKERYWYEELKATLNSQLPIVTKEEIIIKYKEHNKNYYQEHKEEQKIIGKKYREENKDKINDYLKQYREDNNEEIKKYKTKKIICDCGCIISFSNLSAHKKSQKHLNFMTP